MVESKVPSASMLEGRHGRRTNYDAGRGKVRDWALFGDRTRRVWANMNGSWLRSHDSWR